MEWIPTIGERSGPLYLRIVGAISDDIASGRLREGQLLPTHRALATALGLDLTTVTRAYAEARRLGLTEAHVGRGTFVKATTPRRPLSAPAIDLSMNIPPQPAGAALGARLAKALTSVRNDTGFESYLNYQQPGGTRTERAAAAQWLQPLVPDVNAEHLVIAPGTQAAIFALLLMLCPPGGALFTEKLTYPGLKAAAAALGIRLIGIDIDADGLVPKALERACREHSGVRTLYLMPTMHNPTTATLPPERRARIARIMHRHALTLIEDDPYAFLAPGVAPVARLIPGRTYLAASLSKAVTPGLRTSLVVTPDKDASASLVSHLRATLQMAPPLTTAVAMRWLRDGSADAIRNAVRTEAAARQKLAAEALQGHTFSADPYGPHLWLPLPPSRPSAIFASQLQHRGLGVVTGKSFAVDDAAPGGVRIALGAAPTRAVLSRALEIVRETLESDAHALHVV